VWATLSRTFRHEPTNVEMKQTSSVFFTRLARLFFLTNLQCVPFHIIQKLSDLLKFLRCLIFIGEEDNSYLNILFFLFRKIINLFDSYYGRSINSTNRHAVSSRKLMLLSEGIYFLKHFFSCSMFGKWTAKEKLFHVVLSRAVSHEHHELCIVSYSCSLV